MPQSLRGFQILERLGAGGVGEVFLARSRGGKLVAIKVIGDARDDERSADALAREASVVARLSHPCIVQVRAFLEEPGFAACVFEYVPGVALARLVRFCHSRRVRLPDRAAWHIVERVLAALEYAHDFKDDKGEPTPIVHRDLSPANVLVEWTGGVKIADFGIAKVLGVSPATRLGLVKGTLGCMAPEQARGEPVTERADVYGAALLAWRLATGRVPFQKHQRDEFELLRAMRNPRIKPLSSIRPDLPEPLLDAIARALEPEPERRTITAHELARVVRASVDIAAGWHELGGLLYRWKPALEKTVKRTSTRDLGDRSSRSSDSGGTAAHTLRYEEVALAFDDEEAPADGPTFEAHALPSDPAVLAAIAVEGEEPAAPLRAGLPSAPPLPPASVPPPPALAPTPSPPPAAPPSAAPSPAPSPARSAARWLPALVAAALVCAFIAWRLASCSP
jgi:serine/threonine-protein kinase